VYSLDEGIALAREAAAEIERTPLEKRGSSDKLFLGRCYQALGASLLVQGKAIKKKKGLQAAAELLQGARKMFQACVAQIALELSAKHPIMLSVLENIAQIYTELEEYDEAFKALLKVLGDLLQVAGDNHIAAGKIMVKVGKAYKERKDSRNAIAYLERGLANRMLCVGPLHPDIPDFFTTLADIRLEVGDIAGVINDLEEAVPLLEKHDKKGEHVSKTKEMLAQVQEVSAERGKSGIFNVSTINLLGNAYNPLEFMCGDRKFQDHYPTLRLAFANITSERVAEESQALGFSIDCAKRFLDLFQL
jgi:tetratricopeptide (TPR) repeat protein